MKYIYIYPICKNKEIQRSYQVLQVSQNHGGQSPTIGDTPIFHGSPWSYERKGTPSTPPKVERMEPENDGFSKFGFHVKLEGWMWDFIGNKLEGKGERGWKVFNESILLDGGLVNIINTAWGLWFILWDLGVFLRPWFPWIFDFYGLGIVRPGGILASVP